MHYASKGKYYKCCTYCLIHEQNPLQIKFPSVKLAQICRPRTLSISCFCRPGQNPIQIINKMFVKLILTQFVWLISIFKNTYRRPSTSSPLKPLIGFWPNFTGMIPGWSPTKVVKIVLIGCISRSRGQIVGFQNAIFKNPFVWKYKAQSFHICYIASSRGSLLKLFKLCPWGQNWPCPVGHNFTLNYIRKSLNDIFSWTANGYLTKLNRVGGTLPKLFKWFWLEAYVVHGVKK